MFIVFNPIFSAKELIIDYGLRPVDVCTENPQLWEYIKKTYILTFIFSSMIIYNIVFNAIFVNKKCEEVLENENLYDKHDLKLLIGKNEKTNKNVYIPEKGLYQNFLITGTIGTGKTSSAMYPFTKQLMEYNYNNPEDKIGMLILDVKGNYYSQVKEYAKKYNLEKDLFVLELNSKIKYNPLHKPRTKTSNFSK